jgi:hypothetical protein
MKRWSYRSQDRVKDRQLNWERARLEVEISEKKLTLFEAQGA